MSEGDIEAPPTHHDTDEDGENTTGWYILPSKSSLVSSSLVPRLIPSLVPRPISSLVFRPIFLFHQKEPGYKARGFQSFVLNVVHTVATFPPTQSGRRLKLETLVVLYIPNTN